MIALHSPLTPRILSHTIEPDPRDARGNDVIRDEESAGSEAPHTCAPRAVDLYHRAAAVAERALVIDPSAGFALTDILPLDTIVVDLRDPALGIAVVAGTLAAAVGAVSTADAVSALTGPGREGETLRISLPDAPGVTERHMLLARALLVNSIRLNLSAQERGDLVTVMTTWRGDFDAFIERSSVALCILAAAAALMTEHARSGR